MTIEITPADREFFFSMRPSWYLRDQVMSGLWDTNPDMQSIAAFRLQCIADHAARGGGPIISDPNHSSRPVTLNVGRDVYTVNRKAGQWQPIESAPKSGTALLAWPDAHVSVGWWNLDLYRKNSRPYFDGHFRGADWMRVNQPTHWMPLPDAPTGDAA